MNVLCIDIGGTNIKYSIFKDGIMSNIESVSTPKELKVYDLKSTLFPIIDDVLSKVKHLDMISFSTCGQMRDNIVVYTASRPSYIGCDWSKIILERYNIPCVANNDLHCAVMGEYHFGLEGRDKPKNFNCISIGTGINVGTIINGEIFTGDNNLACYFDNITDLDGNNKFKCASTGSLLTMYSDKSNEVINGKEFIIRLKNEEATARECYSIWIKRIANSIKCISYMFNINTIVVSGGILNAKYPILEDVKAELVNCIAKPYYDSIELLNSNISSSQLYGAYAYALKYFNKI